MKCQYMNIKLHRYKTMIYKEKKIKYIKIKD